LLPFSTLNSGRIAEIELSVFVSVTASNQFAVPRPKFTCAYIRIEDFEAKKCECHLAAAIVSLVRTVFLSGYLHFELKGVEMRRYESASCLLQTRREQKISALRALTRLLRSL
jgi:hypothetical protein